MSIVTFSEVQCMKDYVDHESIMYKSMAIRGECRGCMEGSDEYMYCTCRYMLNASMTHLLTIM